MKEPIKELQELKGTGKASSRRLVEYSCDAIAKDEEMQS